MCRIVNNVQLVVTEMQLVVRGDVYLGDTSYLVVKLRFRSSWIQGGSQVGRLACWRRWVIQRGPGLIPQEFVVWLWWSRIRGNINRIDNDPRRALFGLKGGRPPWSCRSAGFKRDAQFHVCILHRIAVTQFQMGSCSAIPAALGSDSNAESLSYTSPFIYL